MVLLWDLNCKTQAIIYLVFFTLFFLFLVISYARIVSQKPGHPSSVIQSIEFDPNATQIKPFSLLGEPTWCDACQVWKPDRSHHCRVCDACVLKMDQ